MMKVVVMARMKVWTAMPTEVEVMARVAGVVWTAMPTVAATGMRTAVAMAAPWCSS